MYNGITTQTVRQNIGQIKEAIRITRGFRLDHLKHLEDTLNHFGDHKQFAMATSIKEFLIFIIILILSCIATYVLIIMRKSPMYVNYLIFMISCFSMLLWMTIL